MAMKFLTDRKEIAKAINIDRIPVITINIAECMNGFADCYEGSKIRIAGAHSGRYADLLTRCTVRMYGDKNKRHDAPWLYEKIQLDTDIVCLSADFSLRDVDEMVEWSNTPIVKAEDPVVVYFRGKDRGYLRMMKIGKRIDPFCQVATYLEDVGE